MMKKIRRAAEMAAFAVYPVVTALSRGYCDAGTVFGDMMVVALGAICIEAAANWLQEGRKE